VRHSVSAACIDRGLWVSSNLVKQPRQHSRMGCYFDEERASNRYCAEKTPKT
jgi:hypothetical protein